MARFSILPLIWVLALANNEGILAAEPPVRGIQLPQYVRPGNPPVASLPRRNGNPGIQDAIRMLESYDSIAAKFYFEFDLLGHEMRGSGEYLERQFGSIRLMRFDLKTKIGDDTGLLVQACDGRYLWTYHRLFDQTQLTKIDLADVEKKLHKAKFPQSQLGINLLHTLGGLGKLMRNLNKFFEFAPPKPGVLTLRTGRAPIVQLRGQWRRKKLENLLPEQAEAIQAGTEPDLPDHMPDHVYLILGSDNAFPYQLSFCRTDEEGKSRRLVRIHIDDLKTNTEIDPNRFQYNPGGLDEVKDLTDSYLRKRGVMPESK